MLTQGNFYRYPYERFESENMDKIIIPNAIHSNLKKRSTSTASLGSPYFPVSMVWQHILSGCNRNTIKISSICHPPEGHRDDVNGSDG